MENNDLILLSAVLVMLFFAHFSKRWSIISPIVFIIFLFAENRVAAFVFSHLYKKWSIGTFFVFPIPFIFSLSRCAHNMERN